MTNSFASVIEKVDSTFSPDVIIELTAQENPVSLTSDFSTMLWSYKGRLIKGPQDTLSEINGSYLGPTLQFNTGDKVKIIFRNKLPESSIVHWHGLDVSHENDGHPHFAVNTGDSYEYNFVVQNRAGMYWYHPHPHGRTGKQVFNGLAGLFIVRDQVEKKLTLPNNDQEMNFVFQDRLFDKQGNIDYRPTMMGAHGNVLMVNGKIAGETVSVKQGTYRIRILNGCNARVFNLALSNGLKIFQIGSDGGLLEKVNELELFYLAPSERVDFLLDFSEMKTGEKVSLDMYNLSAKVGDDSHPVLEFEVNNLKGERFNIPKALAPYKKLKRSDAVNSTNIKKFELVMAHGKGWTINGQGYEADRYEDYEIINFGDTEIWEFYNPTGMPHPMHIHGTPFQILSRTSVGPFKGSLDEGLKDTVLLMPGDRVQIIKEFNTFKGVFLYHCHNLEHEDFSMMRNYKIV
jgi:FtsP/CotA-like multicopper oxidase with cupredoxin domain